MADAQQMEPTPPPGNTNSVHTVHSVQEWDKPVPFNNPNTPGFPVESLPGAVGAFVEQLAESTQTPEEMAGILSLGILATAFQSRYEVEITPDWREPLCLYSGVYKAKEGRGLIAPGPCSLVPVDSRMGDCLPPCIFFPCIPDCLQVIRRRHIVRQESTGNLQ